MGMFGALDLVIAMPVSWLPLVADYARHGKRSAGGLGGAFSGTWIGYVLANIWCYALGVMVVSVAEPGTDLVAALLLAQGGLVALGLILIDELDNAYGDVYSGSVSAHSLQPRWSVRRWGLLLAAVCIGFALVLPMHSLEPFLLLLSSVFVPLYGVILGRLGTGSAPVPLGSRRVDPAAAGLWIGGIAVYHACAAWAPQWGSALPTLALTFVLALVTRPARQANARHWCKAVVEGTVTRTDLHVRARRHGGDHIAAGAFHRHGQSHGRAPGGRRSPTTACSPCRAGCGSRCGCEESRSRSPSASAQQVDHVVARQVAALEQHRAGAQREQFGGRVVQPPRRRRSAWPISSAASSRLGVTTIAQREQFAHQHGDASRRRSAGRRWWRP